MKAVRALLGMGRRPQGAFVFRAVALPEVERLQIVSRFDVRKDATP